LISFVLKSARKVFKLVNFMDKPVDEDCGQFLLKVPAGWINVVLFHSRLKKHQQTNGMGIPIPTPPNKRMNKVKLNLRDKSDGDLAAFGQQHITAMAGNANFTTPLPPVPTFATLFATFNTAFSDFNTAQQTAKQKTAAKEAARQALEAGLSQRGNYVELTAAGDESKILSAGLDVRVAKTPSVMPDQVPNLSLTSGDNDGELDAQWDPVDGAKSYDVETSPEPMTTTSWTSKPSVTKSKSVLLGLTSGSRVWVHVRAVGAGGIGAWSDPAVKIAP
jgi:hypothetical protein